jgi:hypothetical protein
VITVVIAENESLGELQLQLPFFLLLVLGLLYKQKTLQLSWVLACLYNNPKLQKKKKGLQLQAPDVTHDSKHIFSHISSIGDINSSRDVL